MNNVFCIVTRFSVINRNASKGTWVLSRDNDFEEYVSALLDADRLKMRFKIFRWALENTQKAIDCGHDIIQYCFYSELFPDWAKKEIAALSQQYPWLEFVEVGVDDNLDFDTPVLHILKQKAEGQEGLGVIGVRLDDDDLLPKAFFDDLSDYFSPNFVGFAISLARGFCGFFDVEQGRFTRFNETKNRFNAQGLAKANIYHANNERFESPGLIPRGAHPLVDDFQPAVVDAREPRFLYTVHKTADSVSSWSQEQYDAGLVEDRFERLGSRTVEIEEVRDLFCSI